MNWFGIVILVLVCGLTTWLVIDTVVWVIKRAKDKKNVKKIKEESSTKE